MGYEDESFIAYFLKREKDCNGPDTLEVNFQLAFLDTDGSILTERTPFRYKFSKNTGWGSTKFVGRERVFVSEKDAFMPEDTLNVQCCIYTIGEKPAKTNRIFATTVIKVKRRSFVWRIDKFSTLKSCIRHIFKDYLFVFDLVLNEGFDKLYMHMTSFDDSIKYISRKTSIIDSEGGKKNCEIKKYFEADLKKRVLPSTLLLPKMLMENKSLYLPNDVLSFDFELVISTFEHFNCEKKSAKLKNEVAGKEKSHKTAVLIKYYKSLYNDSFFSDMELRTSTKTFPIHKAILSYKSPVFRNMFSHDMKEKNRRYVDITDFEDDTYTECSSTYTRIPGGSAV
ncbi:hypothetical protein AVEN_180043-1 [Araneus ventricosus]|uniref:BTB domain-containing protein n=1 Tax=Araneus ventricosus TaxID=182803 RepID=A0A4Y2JP02_ARAVE|nr:hypothetical protein AVEN_180043-1 [Araneus ventricosus]